MLVLPVWCATKGLGPLLCCWWVPLYMFAMDIVWQGYSDPALCPGCGWWELSSQTTSGCAPRPMITWPRGREPPPHCRGRRLSSRSLLDHVDVLRRLGVFAFHASTLPQTVDFEPEPAPLSRILFGELHSSHSLYTKNCEQALLTNSSQAKRLVKDTSKFIFSHELLLRTNFHRTCDVPDLFLREKL